MEIAKRLPPEEVSAMNVENCKRRLIRGNKALAKELGVHYTTIGEWKKEGLFDPALVVNFRNTFIYDLDIVFECLHHRSIKEEKEFRRKYKLS